MPRRAANLNTTPSADLTVRQVADELQVDATSVYKLIHDGILPAYSPLGAGAGDRATRRALRVRRADLDLHKAGNLYEPRHAADAAAPKRRPRLADHAEHQAALAWLRERGIA
jgi:excisionase family DNA binding protein